MIERQVIVDWYTPDQKVPPENIGVITTISGKVGDTQYDHAMVTLFWSNEEGWYSSDYDFDYLIVHAWCDLNPYGLKGGKQ